MFLGDELTEILVAIEHETTYKDKSKEETQIGVIVLPHFSRDLTDRNRTSPFAFTGNKFEFRMIGSTFSLAGPNIVLNTIVAEALSNFADELEKADDFDAALQELIKATIHNHKRIVFNGDGYSEDWVVEAKKRGLNNLKTTVDALPTFKSQKNIELFTKHGIFTKEEVESRFEILMESYCKTINIEALTLADMVQREIIPACIDYQNEVAKLLMRKKEIGGIDVSMEENLLRDISDHCAVMPIKLAELEEALQDSREEDDPVDQGRYFRDRVVGCLDELRIVVDELELLTSKAHWPYPSYGDTLFSVDL
jgi:glutamine synthetase